MKNIEEWRQHPIGIWVSNKGRVITKRKGINYGNNNNGYKSVDWKYKHYSVHRLVAETFIPNPNNLPMINHKDENKKNNCVENLEWCDNKYNLNYGTTQARKVAKLSIPILQYTRQGEFVREWASAKIAARELGYNSSQITGCCKGRHKTCKGYIWRYKDIA